MDQSPSDRFGWTRLGEREWVRTERPAQVNLGLIVGETRALAVDTGAGPRSAARQLAAIRAITDLPLIAVNTHHHYDHALGNRAFADAGVEQIWAHPAAIEYLELHGEEQRGQIEEDDGEPEMRSARGVGADILPADHPLAGPRQEIDLGGHRATIMHLGRAHTEGDLLISSSRLLFAGDVVEESGPPQFEDAYPREWLTVIGKILESEPKYSTVVPGHGSVMNLQQVASQYRRLERALELGKDACGTLSELPFGPVQSRTFLQRLNIDRDR